MSDPLGKESTWKTFNSLLLVKNGKEKNFNSQINRKKNSRILLRSLASTTSRVPLLPLLEFNIHGADRVVKSASKRKQESNRKKTSRERQKSAPYLRLKNSKRTLKCQVFSFTVQEKPKRRTKLARRDQLARDPGALKGDPLGIFNSSVAKHQKIEGGPLEEIKNFSKKSHNAKKLKGGLGVFQHP